MTAVAIVLAVAVLAFANGSNDNIKGAATLFGGQITNYRRAIAWGTVTTLLGSLCSLYLAEGLLLRFSGHGLVPAELVSSPSFVLAVASGAASTVLFASRVGMPISTTHSLVGALVGAGYVGARGNVSFAALGATFVLPLLASPVLAIGWAVATYAALRWLRRVLGVRKELCVCVGSRETVVALPETASALALRAEALSPDTLGITIGDDAVCRQRYAGSVAGVSVEQLTNSLHVASAGLVSFARGLNDTPKMAALLLVFGALDAKVGLATIALAMALGGLLAGRRVAETMALRITTMSPGQGLAANLATSLVVLAASRFGAPVSTTHVSAGSLFGIGMATGQGRCDVMKGIVLAWLVTLPLAAACAALVYLLSTP